MDFSRHSLPHASVHGGGRTVQGIGHITFIVRDLNRVAELLCQAFGAREVYGSAG